MTADVRVINHGTLVVFVPLTDEAEKWTELHVGIPSYMRLGSGFACEHRMANDLIDGYRNSSFVLEGG